MAEKGENLTNQIKGKEVKTLKPKNDVVFQRLFNKDNPEITKAFVEVMIDEKVDRIEINNDKELLSENLELKSGSLDLQVDVNDKEKVDVEIQLVERENFPERLLFYFSKLYLRGIKRGETYLTAKKVVIVAIINYELKIEKISERMETIWHIVEDSNPELILTNKFELRILELNKGKKEYKKDKQNQKAQWLLFLDNPETKEVKEIMEKNKEIKEAVMKVRELSQDEKLQRLADLREKAIMDEKAIYQAGLNNGKEEGRAEGEKLGREKQRAETMREVAKKLLKQNMKIENIAEITGLTIEEIEKLKDK